MSLRAYQQTQNATENPRETEYRIFAEVTRALLKAQESKTRDQGFFEAIDWNRRLWSTLSTDCSTVGNGLPKELRAQIISIAIWVGKHSTEVALGRAEMEDLIDVNRTIMEGLSTQSEVSSDK